MAFITFQEITNGLGGLETRNRINQGFSTSESAFVGLDSRISENETALQGKQDNMVQALCAGCTADINPADVNTYEDIPFDSFSVVNTDYIIYDGSQKEFVAQQDFKARIVGTFIFGKDSGAGTAIIGVRITINGVQQGTPVGVKISSEDSGSSAYSQEIKELVVGDRIKFQLFRDSSGSNLGGLRSIDTFAGFIQGANVSICKS